MGLMDQLLDKGGSLVGPLASKLGIDPDQAKNALDRIVPYVRDKLASSLSGGHGAKLVEQIKQRDLKSAAASPSRLTGDAVDRDGADLMGEMELDAGERETHVSDVAHATGLPVEVVRRMMPVAAVATAGAMDADGVIEQILAGQRDLIARLQEIQRDVAAGRFDKSGKP